MPGDGIFEGNINGQNTSEGLCFEKPTSRCSVHFSFQAQGLAILKRFG